MEKKTIAFSVILVSMLILGCIISFKPSYVENTPIVNGTEEDRRDLRYKDLPTVLGKPARRLLVLDSGFGDINTHLPGTSEQRYRNMNWALMTDRGSTSSSSVILIVYIW